MSTVTRDVGLYLASVVFLRFVPREREIPGHYLISTYARHALTTNQSIIDSTPQEPTGLSNVTWPLRKIFGECTRLFDYAIDGPFITLAYNIEKAVRGDFSSAVQLAEQNVKKLKEHNIAYQEELDKLEPVKQTVIEVMELADRLTSTASNQILEQEREIIKLQNEISDITQARKEIDLDKVREAAEKVSEYIQKTLNDPKYVDRLQIDDTRLTVVQEKLTKATEKLEKTQKKYQEKLETLSALMDECEELGEELTESVKTYIVEAHRRIEKFKTKPLLINDVQLTVQS